MNSPTTAYFRNRLSTQMRRVLPLYIITIALIVFFANSHFVSSPLRAASKYKRELRYQKLQPTPGPIPRKIWQTWKTSPLQFEPRDFFTARSWVERNAGWRYEVLTDDNQDHYVEFHYGPHGINRPDLIELYKSISAPVVKSDLLRYMIMYAEGGVYADIDVESLRPISRFIPNHYTEKEVDMVIGVEIDEPEFSYHPILGPKSRSFCQWTFMCRPRLPVMLRLIENIQDWLHDLAYKQGCKISELKMDFDDVISGSGPSAFTNAIIDQMNANNKGRKKITWDMFHDLSESTLVNGFLVLDVEAFAAGQGHSDSGTHNARGALIKHHYHASGWPTRHPRKFHPMFGEVEPCNWDRGCVDEWDRNTAEWDKLPKEEQDKQLKEKEALDKLEEERRQREEGGEGEGNHEGEAAPAEPPGPDLQFTTSEHPEGEQHKEGEHSEGEHKEEGEKSESSAEGEKQSELSDQEQIAAEMAPEQQRLLGVELVKREADTQPPEGAEAQ